MVGSRPLQSPNSKGKESNPEFGFEELSWSIADSFLDFEYIRDWIEENPEPCKSMASDLKAKPVGLSSEKVEVEVFDGRPEVGSAGFGDKIKDEDEFVGEEGGKLGSLGPLGQEKIGTVEIEKGSQMCCQSSSEIITVREGVEVELGNSECLEEGKEKVSLDGEVNDLVSAFGGMSGVKQNGEGESHGNDEKFDGEVIGGGDVAKSVEVASASCNGVESGLAVGFASEDARINEILILDDRIDDKKGRDGGKGDDVSESESQTQSSSSSAGESVSDSESESESESSSDDDDDEGDKKGKWRSEVRERGRRNVNGNKDMEMEEGEIVLSDPEDMVAWSDEDDGSGVASVGPPRSKNEITVLPPVPPVNVTLEPHHQILPIGAVSSVIGAQVIVEGVEKHNPVNDGSILWITESGSPLGFVDEIFGPVKNPYYVVRYNSESEVPAGIQPGTSISSVPEFANHILNDKSLYQKGYDASGANDEELVEEDEFSDDEKEAEYKKMLKNKKRGTSDAKVGNQKRGTSDAKVGNQRKYEKKFGNRSKNWKYDPTANTQEPVGGSGTKQHFDPSRHHLAPTNLSPNQGIQSLPSVPGQGLPFQPGLAPPFAQLASSAGFGAYSGGVNGIPFQQPQNVGLPQIPTNGMPLVPQMLPQQLFQVPSENRFPFQQQINATSNFPSSLVLPGCQSGGFGAGPAFLPWPACLGPNPYMGSPFGMGAPMQQPSLHINAGQQAPPSTVSPIQQASIPVNAGQTAPSNTPDSQQHTAFSNKPDTSQRFVHGKHYGGGRKPHPHRRGGGRFRGGRGNQNSF